jgi:uncharacterized protein VirK/YbjX
VSANSTNLSHSRLGRLDPSLRRSEEMRSLNDGRSKPSSDLKSSESAKSASGRAQGSRAQGGLLSRLWREINAPSLYRGYSISSIKGKTLMLLKYRALRRWHSMAHDPRFAWMVERHPLFPALTTRPYINAAWSMQERRQVLEQHYAMLDDVASILHFAPGQSITLTSLDEVEQGVQLTLDKPHWLADEGEVAINLFVGDTRIYSLVFTLGERKGRRIAYVGALQGKAGGNGLEENRRLTRAAHGMRPRDLLFAAFRMLCTHMRVVAILAIADANNICHSAYFNGSKQIYVQHDPTWQEYGGVIRSDGFFEVPVPVPYRDADDVPARKRAMYRRRYAMLHRIDTTIATRIKDANRVTVTETVDSVPGQFGHQSLLLLALVEFPYPMLAIA